MVALVISRLRGTKSLVQDCLLEPVWKGKR